MAMDVRSEEDVAAKDRRLRWRRAAPSRSASPMPVWPRATALHKTSMEFWRNMMATNLDGAFLTIREMFQIDCGRPIGGG